VTTWCVCRRLGAVESLNVSVAAGMLLYEVVRQRNKSKLRIAAHAPFQYAARPLISGHGRFRHPRGAGPVLLAAPANALTGWLKSMRGLNEALRDCVPVHPDQSEQVPAMVERYKSMIANGNGNVHRFEDWGRRSLAFPIAKSTRRTTCCSNIECDQKTLNELTGAFRFSDAVLRHLVVQMDKAVTEPSPMARGEDEEVAVAVRRGRDDSVRTRMRRRPQWRVHHDWRGNSAAVWRLRRRRQQRRWRLRRRWQRGGGGYGGVAVAVAVAAAASRVARSSAVLRPITSNRSTTRIWPRSRAMSLETGKIVPSRITARSRFISASSRQRSSARASCPCCPTLISTENRHGCHSS